MVQKRSGVAQGIARTKTYMTLCEETNFPTQNSSRLISNNLLNPRSGHMHAFSKGAAV
jgi:uncharacterized protein YigE (DUF2233 family)